MSELAYASDLNGVAHILPAPSVVAAIVFKRSRKIETGGKDRPTCNMVRYKTVEFAHALVKHFDYEDSRIIPTKHKVANWQPTNEREATDLTSEGNPFSNEESWEQAAADAFV
ncbi:hypothetical protein V8C42DRAFT_359755 [Trichoderma barbatum]